MRQGARGLANLVAERAGVSLMTVSRVFNDSPRVAEKTRNKVMKIAREVGYEPSSAARSLRRGRSNLVGYLVSSPDGIRGHFHADAIASLESVLSPRGFMLSLIAPSSGGSLGETIRQLIASGSCAALVVRLDTFADEEIEMLATMRAPIVFASNAPQRIQENSSFSTICFDNAKGCLQAIRYLYTLGHRRIAFFNGDRGWVDSEQREEGFRLGMKEIGEPVNEEWVRYCEYGNAFESAARAMDFVLSSGNDFPTSVICASDEIAVGGMNSARRWNKRVPEDISFVGYDDAYWCRFVTPQLTTIRHDGWELGKNLGSMILDLIEGTNDSPKHVVLETSLVVRESTKSPTPAKV